MTLLSSVSIIEVAEPPTSFQIWQRLEREAEVRHDHDRRFAALTALEDLHFGTIPRVTSEGLTEGLQPLTALTSLTLVRTALLYRWNAMCPKSAVILAFLSSTHSGFVPSNTYRNPTQRVCLTGGREWVSQRQHRCAGARGAAAAVPGADQMPVADQQLRAALQWLQVPSCLASLVCLCLLAVHTLVLRRTVASYAGMLLQGTAKLASGE